MTRVAISFGGAVLFALLFFFALQASISLHTTMKAERDDLQFVDFVRVKKTPPLQRKERIKPKKPKRSPKKPKVKLPKPDAPKVKQQPIRAFQPNLPIDLSANSALGDAMVANVSGQVANANVIPLVRINPIYPKRAKMMKQEGYVRLEFTITQLGTVKDVVVVEAKPEHMFEKAAKRALLKWKFKPKIVNQKAQQQRATLQIDFRLDQ